MGSGGGSTTKENNYQSVGPWHAQAPYLKDAFADASRIYHDNLAQGPYQGDYLAAPTDQQRNAANSLYGSAIGAGNAANSQVLESAGGLVQPGVSGATSALSGLGTFAGTDPTQGNINNANRYSQGFDVPGQVNAAMLDARQQASDVTLPNLYRSAANSGNLNSDRTALAQGVVERGLAQKAAGLSAELRNANYQEGLSNAQQGNAQRLQALAQQGSLGSNAAQAGLGGLSSGISNIGTLGNQAIQGADANYLLNQNVLNNDIQKYNSKQGFAGDQLARMYGIVGGNNWGSETQGYSSKTVKEQPSLMSSIGAGIGGLGSLFKLFGGGG